MRKNFNNYSKLALAFFVFLLALSLINWIGEAEAKISDGAIISDDETIVLDKANPQIQAVMAIQNRHTKKLMAKPDVVGTATGLTDDDKPAMLVFTKKKVEAGVIPDTLEGIPVVVKVTGEILVMKRPSPGTRIDPTGWFKRPVPIGVSTGNKGECSAGTIGARVKDASGNVYALSNNHVYALENGAPLGSDVLQPGRYDTNCVYDSGNVIGSLYDYEPIVFSTSASNTIDAAIALSSMGNLGNATPSNGYGTPKSITVSASVGQAVQKYGRTTSLTKGTIYAINGTVNVSYSSGTATFVNQIIVRTRKAFIKPGDSGSLLVTDPGRDPVGLLFAGNSSGTYSIANPINEVLNSFQVTIDGE